MPMHPQHNVLRTKLRDLLSADDLARVGITAHGIGIAENTLRTLLDDDFDQIARTTIERVCDRFGLSLTDLFELVPSPFWTPLIEAGQYLMLRVQPPTVPNDQYEPRDAKARSIVTTYLADAYKGIRGRTKTDLRSVEEIISYVQRHNCIVVGSPISNVATEVVITTHFHAAPFSEDPQNRAKVPFCFVFPPERAVASSIAEPLSEGLHPGLYSRELGMTIAQADWWRVDEYFSRIIDDGRDCALILVINKPFGTSRDVKTIVLAGFSGIGTQAAAVALVRDFRDLEPTGQSNYTIGVIEATYRKTVPHQDNRVFKKYMWRFLAGGRKVLTPRFNAKWKNHVARG